MQDQSVTPPPSGDTPLADMVDRVRRAQAALNDMGAGTPAPSSDVLLSIPREHERRVEAASLAVRDTVRSAGDWQARRDTLAELLAAWQGLRPSLVTSVLYYAVMAAEREVAVDLAEAELTLNRIAKAGDSRG